VYEGDASEHLDVTTEILGYWLPDAVSLPAIKDLGHLLDQPLHERAKIPLDRYGFDALITGPNQLSDRIEPKDISALFRIDYRERADGLCRLISYALMENPPDDNATENAFILFWDSNIRKVMETLIPGGVSIRDSNRHTSTKAQRPDFGFLYLNICPFRGEEKSSSNKDDPRDELVDKMTWIYDPAPYVLGKPTGLTLRPFLVSFAQDTMPPELW
jgi:hypothetical protein